MFFRLFALFAVLAVAFANPKPEPQVAYVAAAPAAYPYAAGFANVATGYSPYVAAGYPYGYSAYYYR